MSQMPSEAPDQVPMVVTVQTPATGVATASVVLGVLSFLPVLGWLSILGLILALVGRGRGEHPLTRSRAKAGVWINAISLAWFPILVALVVSGTGAALLGLNHGSTAAAAAAPAAPWSPPASITPPAGPTETEDPQEVARDQRLAMGELTPAEQQFLADVDSDRAALIAADFTAEVDVVEIGYGICSYVDQGVSESDAATELAGQNYLDPAVATDVAHAAVAHLC